MFQEPLTNPTNMPKDGNGIFWGFAFLTRYCSTLNSGSLPNPTGLAYSDQLVPVKKM